MIAFLRKHTGRKLEPGRLVETGLLSTEAITLWREIRELCQARPSPLNAPDLFLNMAPIVTIRGTKAAVKFYRALKAEVEERVAYHVGAIPEERYRLLWDNIAIWHHLYHFYSQFVDYGACFVVDTYTGGWSMSLEEGEPITALARTYTSIFLNQNMRVRARNMIKSIRDYDVDGFVMHSNRSCKPYSVGQYDIQRLVAAETGRPEEDILRERGNNYIEHKKEGTPPLLAFKWEIVQDGRTFDRPVNYALIRIIPPEGV